MFFGTLFRKTDEARDSETTTMMKRRKPSGKPEHAQPDPEIVSAILDNIDALVVAFDTEGRLLLFNHACEQSTGYSSEEVLGEYFWDVIVPEKDVANAKDFLQEVLANTSLLHGQNHFSTKDQGRRLVAWTARTLFGKNKKTPIVVGQGIDITERKQTEKRLKLLSAAIEQSQEGLAIVDLDGNLLFLNPAFAAMHGYEPDQLLGEHLSKFHTPDQMTEVEEANTELRAKGTFKGEIWHVRRDGSVFPTLMHNALLRDESGNPAGMIGTLLDITERKRAEEALSVRLAYEEGLAKCSRTLLADEEDALTEALQHLQKASKADRVYVFENQQDPVAGFCTRQTHEVCSRHAKPQLKRLGDLLLPYEPDFKHWRQCLSRGEAIAGSVQSLPDAERVFLEMQDIKSILVLPITVRKQWYGFVGFDDTREFRQWGEVDIRLLRTAAEMIGAYIERKQATEAVESERRQLLSLFDSIGEAIYVTDPSTNEVLFANKTLRDLLERDPVGRVCYEEFQGKDAPCEFCTNDIILKNGGAPHEWEFYNPKIGADYMIMDRIIKWPDGRDVRFEVAFDITERKRAEEALQKAHSELEQRVSERTSELSATNQLLKHEIARRRLVEGELIQAKETAEAASHAKSDFIATMSHELRTPLTGIFGFIELLERQKHGLLTEDQQEFVGTIRRNSEHLLALINDVLDVSKIEAGRLELQPSPFDLMELICRCVTMVRSRAIEKGVDLSCQTDSVGTVVADERKVKQVVLNLLSNACKFTEMGGKVNVSAVRGEREVIVTVRDTGIGIAPEDIQTVFEEFSQLDRGDARRYGGTGLGLSLAKKFVELHGGRIWVESKPNEGSRFHFTLPLNTSLAHSVPPLP